MGRVAGKLAEQKESEKAAELARKQRQNRKYGKKIQIAREQEKAVKVSEEKRKLNLLRKRKPTRTEDEFNVDVDDEAIFSDREDDNKKRSAPRAGGKRAKSVSAKRKVRNEKYGFGGRKRGLKRNDKESFEADGFDARKNRQPFPGMGKKKMNRPGKQRRQQMRNHKKTK